jgi:hypothetical protein
MSNVRGKRGLSVVDLEYAEVGSELTLLWGEAHMPRPTVEKNSLR